MTVSGGWVKYKRRKVSETACVIITGLISATAFSDEFSRDVMLVGLTYNVPAYDNEGTPRIGARILTQSLIWKV